MSKAMTEKEKLMVVFTHEDKGNSRMYYKTFDKPARIFCQQENPYGLYVWFACSRDGEPSHEVTDLSISPVFK